MITRGSGAHRLRSGVRPRSGRAPCGVSGAWARALAAALLTVAAAGAAGAQTAPGTVLANTAEAVFDAGGRTGLTARSNTHELVVAARRTPAALAFLRLADAADGTGDLVVAETAYSASGTELGPFVPLAAPRTLAGALLELREPVAARPEDVFHQTDTVLLRLDDPDQDRDPLAVETVLVTLAVAATGEREVLRLGETGPGTGRFTGHVATVPGDAAVPGDGVLTVAARSVLLGRYRDADAPADVAGAEALIDPASRVFDAASGGPLDGARLTLVDAVTGAPAAVRGDDGVSAFPATVVSGGTVADASGRTYAFPPGAYRYPWVPPGSYRLQVVPPPGHLAPTGAALADLQSLPGAPWFLDEAGSRGEAFAVVGDTPLRLDVPLDPAGGALYVSKRAARPRAAPGDFLGWELVLANGDDEDALDVTLTDVLPRGFRLRPGTVRVDGAPAPDPTVSGDGATLTFTRPVLAAGASVTIRYLTAVDVAARPGPAHGTAQAVHAGLASNRARATVTVEDDLRDDRCLLVGRVVARDCDAPADSTTGVPGVRLYLEDGTGVVTDDHGRYHFEDVRPGAHVVQLDTATLPPRYAPGACAPDPRRAEHPYSRLVDLQGGTLWRIDFAVHTRPRSTGEATVELAVRLAGDRLTGTVDLRGDGVPLRDRRLSVLLPDGVRYLPGTAALDGVASADPEDRGGALTWRLGDAAPPWRQAVAFAARVDSVREGRDLELLALLTVDTPTAEDLRVAPARAAVRLVPETRRVPGRTYVLRPRFGSLRADLGPADRAALDSLATELAHHPLVNLRVVGHSDSQGIPPRHRGLFPDNHALGLARARSVALYLGARLDLPPERVHVASMGPDRPVADNATAAGRALNRRVEVQAFTEDVVHHLPARPVRDLGRSRAELAGLRPGERWDAPVAPEADPDAAPVFDMAWLERAGPGFELLWPPPGHLPAVPSTKLAVKHDPAWRLSLAVDGIVVDDLNLDGTATNGAGTLAVTRWAGVDLREGDNRCVVTARDRTGQVRGTLTHVIHYPGPPVAARLLPEASELVASGRRPAVIAVRLTDRDGYPARRGMIGTFDVDAPYEPERVRSEDRKAALRGLEEPRPTYTVGRDGVARIRLEPTTRSGEVVLRLPLADRREEVRVWLEPEARDWVLVGLAEGTAGWHGVSGHLENLAADGIEEEFHGDGRLAFFARGRVKGRWLLTAAYDSRRERDDPATADLFGAVDPDAMYTVYGDASLQGHDAASRSPLYVKLERDRFYALFGDMTTGLTLTELSRYDRRLTGLKTGWRRDVLDATAFAAESRQNFAREELRGDGTSGVYRLSRGGLLANSEQVTIEVRDRFRSERVLDTRRLTRFLDYDIDFVAGTLTFREPVFARDEAFNPVWIVVEYETWDDRDPALQAGGRVAAHLAGDRLEVGATGVHEGAHGDGGDLAGLDARADLAEGVRLRAEAAGTDTDAFGRRGAWRSELTAHTRALEARAWARRQERGFGLGQQRFGEAGMFKVGADADWRLHRAWRLAGRALREENLLTGARHDLLESRLAWSDGPWSAHLGHREVADRLAGGDRRSRLLLAGASASLLRSRLRLDAGHEQALDGRDAAADHPTRTGLGAEYQLVPAAALFARGEASHGAAESRRNLRTGVRATPWGGGEVTTSVEQEHREGAVRVFRNAGLKQTWHLDERWSLDGGVDHARVAGDPAPRTNPAVPAAGGPDDGYTALAAGVTCRGRNWRWAQRGEWRTSADGDKWGLDGRVFVEPTGALGLQAGLRLQRTSGGPSFQRLTEWRAGLAWRPDGSPWTVLQRLDHRTERQGGAATDLDRWRIVHNLHVNWQGAPWLQVAARHGARFARETWDGTRHDAYTDLVGLEARRFFARAWDVGLQASCRNAWSQHVHDLSAGAAVGLRLLEDLWLSLGYNVTGFVDRDFTGGYTAQGPYLRFRFRFNQDSPHAMLF